MSDWYEDMIEAGIRGHVRLLRENGFNTTCSCDHDMYVQVALLADGEMKRLHDTLFNAGYRDYTIEWWTLKVTDGHSYPTVHIEFPKDER